MQIAALGECNQLFHDRAKLLGLWQSRLDLLMFDERAGHVREQSLAVLMCPVQAAVTTCVTHFFIPFGSFLLCPAADCGDGHSPWGFSPMFSPAVRAFLARAFTLA